MNWIIFLIGWTVGFLCANVIVKIMMHRAEKSNKEYQDRLFEYHSERNHIQSCILNELSDVATQMRNK